MGPESSPPQRLDDCCSQFRRDRDRYPNPHLADELKFDSRRRRARRPSPAAYASPPRSAVKCAAAPRSSRSLGTSRPSTGWAAIISKGATVTVSTPCSPLPATTSACSCAGSSGFWVPSSARCSPSCDALSPPKKCSLPVLHGGPCGLLAIAGG